MAKEHMSDDSVSSSSVSSSNTSPESRMTERLEAIFNARLDDVSSGDDKNSLGTLVRTFAEQRERSGRENGVSRARELGLVESILENQELGVSQKAYCIYAVMEFLAAKKPSSIRHTDKLTPGKQASELLRTLINVIDKAELPSSPELGAAITASRDFLKSKSQER